MTPHSAGQTYQGPLKELSRVKLRRLTGEHISKNIPKSSKIPDYTRPAHVLRDVK